MFEILIMNFEEEFMTMMRVKYYQTAQRMFPLLGHSKPCPLGSFLSRLVPANSTTDHEKSPSSGISQNTIPSVTNQRSPSEASMSLIRSNLMTGMTFSDEHRQLVYITAVQIKWGKICKRNYKKSIQSMQRLAR